MSLHGFGPPSELIKEQRVCMNRVDMESNEEDFTDVMGDDHPTKIRSPPDSFHFRPWSLISISLSQLADSMGESAKVTETERLRAHGQRTKGYFIGSFGRQISMEEPLTSTPSNVALWPKKRNRWKDFSPPPFDIAFPNCKEEERVEDDANESANATQRAAVPAAQPLADPAVDSEKEKYQEVDVNAVV